MEQMALLKGANGRYGLQRTMPMPRDILLATDGTGSPVTSLSHRLHLLGSSRSSGYRDNDLSSSSQKMRLALSGMDQEDDGHLRPLSPEQRAEVTGSIPPAVPSSPRRLLGAAAMRISSTPVSSEPHYCVPAPSAAKPESPSSEPQEELREKLLSLGSSFLDFDKQIEADTRRRKDLEGKRSQEILAMLAKMEQELSKETSDRERDLVLVTKAIEARLDSMAAHLLGRLQERFGRLSQSVESLTARCSTVECGIQQFKGALPSKLQVETASLKNAIRELSAELVADQTHCADQDSTVASRIKEGECTLDSQLQKELAHLERRGEALQELIDEFATAEESSQSRSQKAALLGNLALLKEAINLEVSEREAADDKVVQARQ